MRRWIEKFLLFSGLILLGIWGGVELASTVWEAWQNRTFDQELQDQRAHTASPGPKTPALEVPALKKGDVLGRLSIPRLDVSTMVREGDDEGVLSLAAGHVPGTALPGQNGNIAVAGHRDTIFRALKGIRKDDIIRFETVTATHEYVVDATNIVMPDDVDVLRSGKTPQLTLVTCYPFYYVGAAPKRFIVSAHEMTNAPQPQIREVREERVIPKKKAVLDEPPAGGPNHAALAPASLDPIEPPQFAEASFDQSRGVRFDIVSGHSTEIAPGISLGISAVHAGHADGWMWVMPDHRSVLFKNQGVGRPLVFYQDGERREVTLTRASNDAVSGSVLLGSD